MAAPALGEIYRQHAGSVLGTLVRWLRDVDRAEEALQDAVAVACRVWPRDGEPANPAAWLARVARNGAIDRLRREQRRGEREERAVRWEGRAAPADPAEVAEDLDAATISDDQLRLLFLCCHPALAPDARVSLTLRTVGGLSTAEIARAFLVPEATMAQRLVRAKRKITAAGIPFGLPGPEHLADRLDEVLHTVYLVFNEGYTSTAGDALVRPELCIEAIRLGRVITRLLPGEAEGVGLLALMLLQDSRHRTRLDAGGELVLLADQDRTQWDGGQIDEGAALVEQALRMGRVGPYQLEAAIAALHATAPSAGATDWAQIAALYGVLMRIAPSPVVELNRAVAVSMDGPNGPAAALALVDRLGADLAGWHRYHATRADVLRRLDRREEALAEYEAAVAAAAGTGNAPERRFLERRAEELRAVR